jgi:hypothetical protein
MEVSGQLHDPVALPPGKEPWYPLDRRMDGPQHLPGIESPIIQNAAQRYTTELSRLQSQNV